MPLASVTPGPSVDFQSALFRRHVMPRAAAANDELPDAGLQPMLVPALTAAARDIGLRWD